jgi:endonuclease/exonuclease/phosphatase family metal-dependent hydrolase
MHNGGEHKLAMEANGAGDQVDRLTVATLNTRGVPIIGSHLADRYGVIADSFEAAEVDVVSFQEVFSYYHLRQLVKRMPSFRHVNFRPSVAGPAGGLITLSRLPLAGFGYHRFPVPSAAAAAALSRLSRFRASLKGTLVTRLAAPSVCIVNTHLAANGDSDWSESNRFFSLHRGQLATLARIIGGLSPPAVVCGDFNISRDSGLHRDFMTSTGLADAFKGRCPPTFRAQYLSPGKSPHCIDFILVTDSIEVEAADLLFTGQQPLSGGPGYVSDHIGLRARTFLPG